MLVDLMELMDECLRGENVTKAEAKELDQEFNCQPKKKKRREKNEQ
ncbi:hypothetical protein [Veillonella magna]|uniref:Complexin-2 n=1 Tax=Veillonella magna TaxID=464322 RepID=A0ABS2GF03_9FIRM|nr:hypothetical protein [Veillonella magna]MBM6823518.1 hypothetical protein [Veillonella magna]MBM6911862.1 hypothetical protein [Veillonella magna]